MSVQPENRQALNRERWMELAIQTLAREGKSKFSLDALLKGMKVSKGSFYWHFKDRADFLFALVEHWDRRDTEEVIGALEAMPHSASPQEKLWELMWTVYQARHSRHDLLIRALTQEFPELKAAVAAVDRKRFDTVRQLFSEMGFSGDELEVRTQVFVVTTSFEPQLFLEMSAKKHERLLKLRHEFFVRP